MEDKDKTTLRDAVAAWLAFVAPTLTTVKNYKWTEEGSDQSLEFLKRGAIVRQYEALEATLKMAEMGIGHFGVTMVRPAYEELIWIKYLDQNTLLSNELVNLLLHQEVVNNMSAQNQFIGMKGMKHLGFTQRFVKFHRARKKKTNARLVEIGRQLGWQREGALPTTKFLSRKVGYEAEYNFLYQGTSRHVHFSTQELFRRVWGKKGEVTVGSEMFSSYWEDFSLYWSFGLLLQLMQHCDDVFDERERSVTSEKYEELINMVHAMPFVPIITKAELISWDD